MRVVLDTNVLVSALLFRGGRLSWLRGAWQAGRFLPLIDEACAGELLRVLGYPRFRLSPDDIEAILGDYLPYAETVAVPPAAGCGLPRCADPHDRKFLLLAGAGRAEVLVTGDRALLNLAGRTPFAVETPAAFRRRLPGA